VREAPIGYRPSGSLAMHFHVNWAGSGFGSKRFDHYQDAVEAACESLENGRRTPSENEGRLDVVSSEIFAIELFDEPCPVCLRAKIDA
jgi:hypothetical protein